MIEITRGSLVQFFGIQFRDADKNATVPESASIRVRYLYKGCEKHEEISLVEDDGAWSGSWDSSPADPGTIYWFLKSETPEAIAAQGEFRLKANPANERGDLPNG